MSRCAYQRGGRHGRDPGRAGDRHGQGLVALFVARMGDERRSQAIGVMYMLLGLIMLLRGFSDAIMMRTQQAIAVGQAQGYLPPDHYDQIFSAHGAIMIFSWQCRSSSG